MFNWKTAESAAQVVKNSLQSLRDEIAGLEGERDALRAKIAELRSKPVCSADAKQFMFDVIDHAAAEFAQSPEWRQVFESFAFPAGPCAMLTQQQRLQGKPLSLAVIDAALRGGSQELSAALGDVAYGMFNVGPLKQAREYFFFGDIIKAKIERHFDELYPADIAGGFPTDNIGQRRETIAQWLQRISDIEVQIGKAQDRIRALGHRP